MSHAKLAEIVNVLSSINQGFTFEETKFFWENPETIRRL